MPLSRGLPGGRRCSARPPTRALANRSTEQPNLGGSCRGRRADHVRETEHVAGGTRDPATVSSRRSALLALVSSAGFFSVPAIARPPGALAAPVAVTRGATLKSLSGAELASVLTALQDTIPPSKAPVMLRLIFHDGATYRAASKDGGVNGSIQYELDRPESFGLKRALFPPPSVSYVPYVTYVTYVPYVSSTPLTHWPLPRIACWLYFRRRECHQAVAKQAPGVLLC
jgi:hypothetical protein